MSKSTYALAMISLLALPLASGEAEAGSKWKRWFLIEDQYGDDYEQGLTPEEFASLYADDFDESYYEPEPAPPAAVEPRLPPRGRIRAPGAACCSATSVRMTLGASGTEYVTSTSFTPPRMTARAAPQAMIPPTATSIKARRRSICGISGASTLSTKFLPTCRVSPASCSTAGG